MTGCGTSGSFLAPTINSVEFNPSREGNSEEERANERDNCNQIVGDIANEAAVKSAGGSEDSSNELVRLPGGMWRLKKN